MDFAMYHHGTRGYGCPYCSCGAVPDWKKEAPLRCTGCHKPLITQEQHEYEREQSLRAQLAAAQEELARLREDAERLDWLCHQLFVNKWNGVVGAGSKTNWYVIGSYRHVVETMKGDTFRAAIDAARNKNA